MMNEEATSPTALIDLDGTVANYDQEMRKSLEQLRSPDEPPLGDDFHHGPPWLEARKRLIRRVPGFWQDLPRIERGFEVVESVRDVIDAVAAESLFRSWDGLAKRYTAVPERDREWLLAKLRETRDAHGIPVTVIDYVHPGERELARDTARRISALGFTPCVTTPDLSRMGVSTMVATSGGRT